MRVAGLGLSALYLVDVWHCTVVNGGRQAIMSFALATVVTFFGRWS